MSCTFELVPHRMQKSECLCKVCKPAKEVFCYSVCVAQEKAVSGLVRGRLLGTVKPGDS